MPAFSFALAFRLFCACLRMPHACAWLWLDARIWRVIDPIQAPFWRGFPSERAKCGGTVVALLAPGSRSRHQQNRRSRNETS